MKLNGTQQLTQPGMKKILQILQDQDEQEYVGGSVLLHQGQKRDLLFVLVKGEVEIVKNDQTICRVSEPGAVFGEISALLNTYHNAVVRTIRDSSFYEIPDAQSYLRRHPDLVLELARLLAGRLAHVDSCFAEMKQRAEECEVEKAALEPALGDSESLTQFLEKAQRAIEHQSFETE